MAGDWIKMRSELHQRQESMLISRDIGATPEEVVVLLYRLAGWFAIHGEYGKIECAPNIVDSFLGVNGIAAALLKIGWLRDQNGVLTLRWFCEPTASRKSLGRVIRADVLRDASCAACGTYDGLVVDHIIPIARGGSSDRSNLQALCGTCNRAKWRQTMEEFMAARS